MARQNRIVVLVALTIVAIVAFVALRPGDDSSPARSGAATGSASSTAPSPVTPASAPASVTVTVRGSAPVDGIRKIAAKQGARVRFVVRADAAEEVHLHGYDIKHDVAPDAPARFSFIASIPGVFEAELEGAGRQIVELTVTP